MVRMQGARNTGAGRRHGPFVAACRPGCTTCKSAMRIAGVIADAHTRQLQRSAVAAALRGALTRSRLALFSMA